MKGKLEQSLDECEDALEREKKIKGDVEKTKRKVTFLMMLSFVLTVDTSISIMLFPIHPMPFSFICFTNECRFAMNH